jgi:hypothetical protein
MTTTERVKKMGHSKEDTAPAASCDALLVKANRIYLEIETVYQTMENDLSATSALQVSQTVGTLNDLLQNAQTIDSLVAEGLKNEPGLSEATSLLLGKREEILKRLCHNNKNMTTRAANVKSLLRHEIASLSTNHNAIKGYKPAGTERKYIIRDSF